MPSSSPVFSGASWREAAGLFRRSQPVTPAMVALALTIPFYLYIASLVHGRPLHVPAMDLDRMIPVQAAWAPVYLSLFLAALLPAFVLHQPELIERTVRAYLAAWLAAYVFFLVYPTLSPRPQTVAGEGFLAWMLRTIWASDVRYNCFPSLHVAQCFIAALACRRVHTAVGNAALAWATAVSLSTLFTKQHYVADVLGGIVLAGLAYAAFIRPFPRDATPDNQRRLAPTLAVAAALVYGVLVAGMWIAYSAGIEI